MSRKEDPARWHDGLGRQVRTDRAVTAEFVVTRVVVTHIHADSAGEAVDLTNDVILRDGRSSVVDVHTTRADGPPERSLPDYDELHTELNVTLAVLVRGMHLTDEGIAEYEPHAVDGPTIPTWLASRLLDAIWPQIER